MNANNTSANATPRTPINTLYEPAASRQGRGVMMMMTFDQLLALFPLQPQPETPLTTSYGEAFDEVAPFENKPWPEMDAETLTMHSGAPFFFTPQAFCYFLPAYIWRSYASLQRMAIPINSALEIFINRDTWHALNEAQTDAVLAWVQWLRTDEEDPDPMTNYDWVEAAILGRR